MYNGLLHAHSGLRWIVLVLLILAIFKAISGWKGRKAYSSGDKKLALFSLIFTHIQLVLGFVLYFISPKVSFTEGFMKNEILRFYTIEHFSLMLVAIGLITAGYSLAKRTESDTAKHKKIAIYFGIGLVLILISIPWPFRIPGAGWG